MRVRSRILLNTIIILVCLAMIGGIGLFFTHHVANMSMSLVEEEAVPILKLNDLETSASDMWLRLIKHSAVSDVKVMQKLEQEMLQLKTKIAEHIQSIEEMYAINTDNDVDHNLEILQTFRENWQQFEKIAHKILLLSQDFTKGDALRVIITKGQPAYDKAMVNISEMFKYHSNNMDFLERAALKEQQQAIWIIITITLLIGIFLLLFITSFSNSLLNPLFKINNHLKSLAQGKPVEDNIKYKENDEIGEIVSSAQDLKASINDTIAQANAVAAGDYSKEVTVRSEQDQLGHALSEMTQTLREVTNQNEIENWLKSGQAQLNQKLSGEQDISQLAEKAINFITPYVQAQMGAIYLFEENHDKQEPSVLNMKASHAYTWRKSVSNNFALGEGLVGQAALERKTILITQAPDDYIYIQSALGDSKPGAILVMPFLYEDSLKGVIEMATFKVFTEEEINFLKQTMPILAIAVNSAVSRQQMQTLLEKTQTQSKELKGKAIELQSQQEMLQQSNEELQAQSEELQSQQEELRQTNEELEERTKALEIQSVEIRKQNISLQESKAEIEKASVALETKAEELELASKYKSEFLANMSHELRTPLNSLLILAQLLSRNKNGNLDEKQIEYAQTIHSAGSDLLTLINEILDLSKVEAGKVEAHPEEFSVNKLAKTIEQKFIHVAEDKGLSFKMITDDALPSSLYTDSQRLNQIINNLLSNAFKFTSEGEIRITMRRPSENDNLSLLKLSSDNSIAISVSDSGIGIPENKQKVIFEAFQQADGSTVRRFGGTGLGLAISRQLARLLGGDLVLESEEGKGSTFTLYIPEKLEIKQSDNTEETVSSSTPIATDIVTQTAPEEVPTEIANIVDDRDNFSSGDKIILIIEDDRKFLDILTELARDNHFKCLLAEDGKTGLELAKQYQPDAILLDVGLPQLDGWSVMEKLKEYSDTRHIPVHFMSAYDRDSDAKQMGAIGYLHKPVNMEELGNAFQKIERFMAKNVKNLLILVDDEQHQQQITSLVGERDIQTSLAKTKDDALQQMKKTTYECFILDVDTEQATVLKLLEEIYKDDKLSQIPVIIYSDRELTETEDALLQRVGGNITIKEVRSPERLLDEATLFLHKIAANLPEEKQEMLRKVHDKEAIFKGKKVLIVDDDIRNTFALMTVLEDINMQVVVGYTGKEALELLEQESNIDIVLMDIMMPEMDGYEAMQKIREQSRFRKLPIIALTAKAMKGDKGKCIEAGANDYLAKPLDTDKLLSLMRVWLYR